MISAVVEPRPNLLGNINRIEESSVHSKYCSCCNSFKEFVFDAALC